MIAQQEAGQIGPLLVMRRRQHCPEAAAHMNGPPHWVMDMTVMPAAPATPTSPIPTRAGLMLGRRAVVVKLATARRAAPPDQTGELSQ